MANTQIYFTGEQGILPTQPLGGQGILPTQPLGGQGILPTQPLGGQGILPAITQVLVAIQPNSRPLFSIIWYQGTHRRTLIAAQAWSRFLSVRNDERIDLTPALLHEIQQNLFQRFGPGFWFHVVVDRADDHVLRITVRLNRAVTATQEAYDAFIENAEAEDRQSKALARAPDWNAFSGPQVAGHDEPDEGFQ